MEKFLFRLFVAGPSSRTSVALENLKSLCESELAGRYEIEVIDVLEQPELAEEEKILATPTVIRKLPPPIRRVVGDLARLDQVKLGLHLTPVATGGRQAPPA